MQDDSEILIRADAPFLNRFEKHHIKLDNILSESDNKVVNQLQDWVKQLLTLK